MHQGGQGILAAVTMTDGASARLSEAVAALSAPAAYPRPTPGVEAIETHMSWVFLTARHAYKLKKPLRTPLLDHTTVALRRAACERELALNRRLAPAVYLGVVPLVRAADGLRVGGRGTVVDWLVEMRRLPRDRMLDACIGRGTVRPEEVDRLGAVLAGFYAGAARAPFECEAYRERLRSDIEDKRRSLSEPRYGLDAAALARLEALVAAQHRWVEVHAGALERRAGAVVDAHGDLRPEHVCLEADPVVIDCLEFCRDLRLLDPLSELGFLALECRRLGAPWIGQRLLDGARGWGMADPEALFAFYQSYHALVRAAVALWHLDDDAIDHTQKWRARAGEYIHLAIECLCRR